MGSDGIGPMPIRLFVNDFVRMPEYQDDFCTDRSSYTEKLPAELVEARKPVIGDMGFLPMLLSAMMESPDLFFRRENYFSDR